MNVKFQKIIEMFFLVTIILLQITDFLEILPGDLDYVKKIISWVLLGYLFVKVSISTILFGHKKIRFDVGIVLVYFLFIFKDMTRYAQVAIEEAFLLKKLYFFLITYSVLIEKYSFYLGGLLLLFIALYMALKFEIRKPSFMSFLHETGKPPKEKGKFLIRFISMYLVLVAFFILIFNLATEWLAIALDAPLTMTTILVYFFIIVRHHDKFNPKHFIYKMGHVGEKFYEKFIEMFHYQKSLYLGIMGLLALHLLTDIGNFIIPYLIGLKDVLYFGHLGTGHTPLIHLLIDDISYIGGIDIIALVLTYLFNIVAMLFLLILPTFIWYRFFKKRLLHVSGILLASVFSSLLCFVLMPAFYINKIGVRGLVGVDIITQSILKSTSLINLLIADRLTSILVVAILCLILGLVIYLLDFNKKIWKDTFIVIVLAGLLFFGFYIFYWFMSSYQYYINAIIFLFESKEFFITFYFVLFAMISVLFYIGGYLFFVYEVFKRHFFS